MERSLSITPFSCAALAALTFASSVGTRADDCRDATGEPTPCAAPAPTPPPESPPSSAAPSPTVEPSAPAPRTDDPTAGVTLDFGGESLDLRPLRLTPSTPGDVADLARDTVLTGANAPFDVAGVTFGVALVARPLRWLEIPTLRLSCGVGDIDETVPLEQSTHTADLGTLLYVRLEIGSGIDVPIGDMVSVFARGHIALAGYFVSARIVDDALGSLGRTWLAEDAWEAGWTLGASVRLDRDVAWVFSYRHVHTGAESNLLCFGARVDIR